MKRDVETTIFTPFTTQRFRPTVTSTVIGTKRQAITPAAGSDRFPITALVIHTKPSYEVRMMRQLQNQGGD